MGKIISFFIIGCLIAIIVWLVRDAVKPKSFDQYEKERKAKEKEFKDVVNSLKEKIVRYKAQATDGIKGAEEALKKYTQELEDIEEFNNKLNN